MPEAQLSSVMIWNSENKLLPREPNHCGKVWPKRLVAKTPAVKKNTDITANTPPSPGMACKNAATTLRSAGTVVNRRNTRRTRRLRMTAHGPAPGTNATPTTTKSKMFHPLRQKMPRKASNLQVISTTKTARHSLSVNTNHERARSMSARSVSKPSTTALIKMTTMTQLTTRRDSIQRPSLCRHNGAPSSAKRCTICSSERIKPPRGMPF